MAIYLGELPAGLDTKTTGYDSIRHAGGNVKGIWNGEDLKLNMKII